MALNRNKQMAHIWCPTRNIQENKRILSTEDLEIVMWSIIQILEKTCKNELLYHMWKDQEAALCRMFVVYFGEFGVRGRPTQRYQKYLLSYFKKQGNDMLPAFITDEITASHRANMLRIALNEHPEDPWYLEYLPEEASMKPQQLRSIKLIYPKHARDGKDDAHGI